MIFEKVLHDLEEINIEILSTSPYYWVDEYRKNCAMWCILNHEISLNVQESNQGLQFSVCIYDKDGTVKYMLYWPNEFEDSVSIESYKAIEAKDDFNYFSNFKFSQRDWTQLLKNIKRILS